MRIHLTLVTYALDITSLVMALQGDDVHWSVFQHSRNMDVISRCQALAQVVPNFTYFDYRENRGLSRSWNDGLAIAQSKQFDVSFIANDDIRASRLDMLKIAQTAVRRPNCGVIQGMGFDEQTQQRQPMAWALAAVNPVVLDTIGYFDENFFPIYYEDTDLARRMALADVRFCTVTDTEIVHIGRTTVRTSSDLKPQQDVTMQANSQYYQRKWGGIPGAEQYTIPFNNPQFGLKIDYAARHSPYPEYNRVDQEIVKI